MIPSTCEFVSKRSLKKSKSVKFSFLNLTIFAGLSSLLFSYYYGSLYFMKKLTTSPEIAPKTAAIAKVTKKPTIYKPAVNG